MLKNLWESWKVIAAKIGDFQATIIFSILYFVLIVPTGIIASIFTDFMKVRDFPVWQDWEDSSGSINKLREQ